MDRGPAAARLICEPDQSLSTQFPDDHEGDIPALIRRPEFFPLRIDLEGARV